MAEITFGKHLLESLTKGMYTDPLTIYREYIQNSADAIDEAVSRGIISHEQAKIHITVDSKKRKILIEDNGIGVPTNQVENCLLDIANSQKDYRKNRGFRGIGRLGGLGYSENLYFVTSFKGEPIKTTIKWDGNNFLKLLDIENLDVIKAADVINISSQTYTEPEDAESHYFKVILENVFNNFSQLIDEKQVSYYLANVAPVPFDGQKFIYTQTITPEFSNVGHPIETYNILLNGRAKPVYKEYTSHFKTGHQERSKKEDVIQDIAFFQDTMPDGSLMYKGWYAITHFYGSVSNPYMSGIRIRKGNILIGNESVFSNFFSEGKVANSWFIGEVHVYNPAVLPNSQRDDFEKNTAYEMLKTSLSKKADEINREHRRLMSTFHSSVKRVETTLAKLDEVENRIAEGTVSSEFDREKLLKEKKEIESRLTSEKKELEKLATKDSLDDIYRKKAKDLVLTAEKAEKKIVEVENKIVNADTATKNDLPTSFSRDERKLYSKIIESIYSYFETDRAIADKIKEKILYDLKEKKKK